LKRLTVAKKRLSVATAWLCVCLAGLVPVSPAQRTSSLGPSAQGPSALAPSSQPVPSSRPTTRADDAALRRLCEDIRVRRESALRTARGVEAGETLDQARANRLELIEATVRLNGAIAPVAATSQLRYGQPQPRQGVGREIWLYKASRQIEAYNASRVDEMSPEEFEVLRLVNEYREALGVLPLEFDPRLRESARGHCQWMDDTKTFSHESDVPGQKTHGQRMEKAGYRWRSAGENIAFGQGSAEEVFTGWFNSPGHHRTMVGEWVHLGVARVGIYWTQNFGAGEPARAPSFRPPPRPALP
jgi:uncharacterized protein YkwD